HWIPFALLTYVSNASGGIHRATLPDPGFAQKAGNGQAAGSEICNRQSSGTQQRCAISSAIALADCTWLLDIGDRRLRIGDVQKPASDFLCKTRSTIAPLGSRNACRPVEAHVSWAADFASNQAV